MSKREQDMIRKIKLALINLSLERRRGRAFSMYGKLAIEILAGAIVDAEAAVERANIGRQWENLTYRGKLQA